MYVGDRFLMSCWARAHASSPSATGVRAFVESDPLREVIAMQPTFNTDAGVQSTTARKTQPFGDSWLVATIINHMVDNSLDATFTALADPTRRGMLAALMLGEQPVSKLAAPYEMSLAGAAKHVSVLARAGLIERRKVGRQQLCRLKADRLKEASDWLAQWDRFWTTRLDALELELRKDPA